MECKICLTHCLCDCGHPQVDPSELERAEHEKRIRESMELLRANIVESYAPSEGHLRYLAHRVVDACLPDSKVCPLVPLGEFEPHE